MKPSVRSRRARRRSRGCAGAAGRARPRRRPARRRSSGGTVAARRRHGLRWSAVNRTQATVLGFFAAAWVALVLLLFTAPEVYDTALPVDPDRRAVARLALVGGVLVLLLVLGVGVLRRWRWMFWLVTVAFLAGALRTPASVAELVGLLPLRGPAWYAALQGVLGLVQLGIGLLLVRGSRRGGAWGPY